MAENALIELPYEALRAEQEASWTTRGPSSEGVRLLLFARGHMWDIDGMDWRFEVVAAWTPEAFVVEHTDAGGPWGEAASWLRARAEGSG